MADLDLIDPSNPYTSAASYSSPNFNPYTSPGSSGSGTIYASMGLSAIGAITSAFTQSAAYKAQGDYEATVANTNAKLAQLQSKQTLEAGDIEASRENLKTQQAIGSVRATQGASGVDVASGSSALVRNSIQSVGQQDELTIRNNAQKQAWGYQTEAIEDTYKGQFEKDTASAESEQSILNGGLKAISGPLSIESNYLRWSRGMTGTSQVPFPGVN